MSKTSASGSSSSQDPDIFTEMYDAYVDEHMSPRNFERSDYVTGRQTLERQIRFAADDEFFGKDTDFLPLHPTCDLTINQDSGKFYFELIQMLRKSGSKRNLFHKLNPGDVMNARYIPKKGGEVESVRLLICCVYRCYDHLSHSVDEPRAWGFKIGRNGAIIFPPVDVLACIDYQPQDKPKSMEIINWYRRCQFSRTDIISLIARLDAYHEDFPHRQVVNISAQVLGGGANIGNLILYLSCPYVHI